MTRPARVVGARIVAFAAPFAVAACLYDWSFPPDGGPSDATTDVACQSILLPACGDIPFISGFQQTFDGKGDEFCAVATKGFDSAKGLYRTCPPPSWMVAGQVTSTLATVASEDGIHVFASVDKHGWPIERNDLDAGEAIYQGDAIELFFAPTTPASGDLTTDHALQVIAAPKGSSGEPPSTLGLVAPQWASASTGTSYAIEMLIPWSVLASAAAPSAMLAEYGIDIRHDGGRFQSFIHYAIGDAGDLYCNGDAGPKPAASDLSWCSERVQ